MNRMVASRLFLDGTHREAVGAEAVVQRVDARRAEVQVTAVVRRVRHGRPEVAVAAVAGPIVGRSRSEESAIFGKLRIGEIVGVVLVECRHEKVRDVSRRRFRSTSLHGCTEIDRVAIVDARRFVLRARCHGKSRHDH